MKLIIDNHDGLGQQDYSGYLDAEHLPKLKRRLNRAAEMQAWLASGNAGFRVPASGARVILQRDDGYKLFTGYLATAPQQEYLGNTQAVRCGVRRWPPSTTVCCLTTTHRRRALHLFIAPQAMRCEP